MKSSDLATKDIVGLKVKCIIDRPLGTYHPKHPDIYYPVNYGYIEEYLAGDGSNQDVYLLGIDEPIKEIDAVVIAVYHRINDVEDKWIVAPKGMNFTDEEILEKIAFQEQYFKGCLLR